MKWLKLFENFDDVETMVRHQLFGVDAQIAFEFCDQRITDPNEIKHLIDMYNQTVIESDQWSGGPVNNEFIEYWNNSGKKKKASRNNWKPCIELIIQTDDYGKMIIGFSIINKKVSKINWSQLSDDVKGYDRKVVDGIYRFVKNKIDEPDLNINQAIDLLKLNVTNWVDWQWRESITENLYQSVDERDFIQLIHSFVDYPTDRDWQKI